MAENPDQELPGQAPGLVVVLAAGAGTRMKSTKAKVLHEVLGTPLLGHVLREVDGLSPAQTAVVVGHQREAVEAYVGAAHPQTRIAVQDSPNGTGHAVRCAFAALAEQGALSTAGTVVVTAGDTPLLTADTIATLLAEHAATDAKATVLTARMADPTGYGRIVRAEDGSVVGIVEHKDATEAQRAIDEINSGVFAFDVAALDSALGRLTTDNSQGEEYLTDVLGILRADGERVSACVAANADDIHGINDRAQLAAAARIMADRVNLALMRSGVTITDPATAWISPAADVAPDAVVERNTWIGPGCTVAAGAVIGPDTTLLSCEVGEGAHVLRSHCLEATIGAGANVGPFTYLRPGTHLGDHAKAGAYVEIKNATVGEGAKVPHLSYVGDAEIGARTNIGAATVFVNYDGENKHHTVVGQDVRIGSDTMLVAPIVVGDGAFTGAGSVITEDVPPGSLALGRARQTNIDGWVERVRPDSPAAEASRHAREDD